MASCYGNQDKLRPYGPLRLYADFTFTLLSHHDSADSEPEPEHAAAPISVRHNHNHQAEQIEWEVYEDFDLYESVWLQDYNERQGILVDTINFTSVDFFHLFMPEAAFELISVEKNRYALQYAVAYDQEHVVPRHFVHNLL